HAANVVERDESAEAFPLGVLALAQALAQFRWQPRQADRGVERRLVSEFDHATIGVTQVVVPERQAAKRGARDDFLYVRGGSRRAEPRDDELLRWHAVQLQAHTVVETDRDVTRAAAHGVAHARRTREGRGDRLGVA